jgi:putative PIN family toxin of toxin-antitoxin system
LLDGSINLAVSTEILLEYEEITTQLSSAGRWGEVAELLERLNQLHGNIRQIDPHYRFRVILADPDDNKFCDCAIAAEADFVITEDGHFDVLAAAGYQPKPLAPKEFISRYLTAAT